MFKIKIDLNVSIHAGIRVFLFLMELISKVKVISLSLYGPTALWTLATFSVS
jgi:hypothetical protein